MTPAILFDSVRSAQTKPGETCAIRRVGRRWRLLATLGVLLLVIAAGSGEAEAANLRTGFSEMLFRSNDPTVRADAFARAASIGTDFARITINWRASAPTEPADRRNPSAYYLAGTDAAVRESAASGVPLVLTISSSPEWAEQPGREDYDFPMQDGAWSPDPAAFADFIFALGTRYSGEFPDPRNPGQNLPKVSFWQIWNEANHGHFFAPQWDHGQGRSPNLYRALLNASYAELKALDPNNTVIVGGTAPYGDPTDGWRMRPLVWWRRLLCVDINLQPITDRCKKATFDVIDHHPIGPDAPPSQHALDHDDLRVADMPKLRNLLRAGERYHTVGGPARHQIWATEIWWETNPPDPNRGIPSDRQAAYLAETLYRLAESGVVAVFNYQLSDEDGPDTEVIQGGIYDVDGVPKPSRRVFAFPFWAERKTNSQIELWAVAPDFGRLIFERRSQDGWRPIATRPATRNTISTLRLKARGEAVVRARLDTLIAPRVTVEPSG